MSTTTTAAATEEVSSEDPIVVDKILLVNTENVTHEEYEQTSELKVEGKEESGLVIHCSYF